MNVQTNDTLSLTPQTSFDGPTLEFDFPGLQIGVAEYAEGPTGCTVFHFHKAAATASDVRGGSVGLTGDYDQNHAICFAGGSLYGLEAATGVTAELFARRGYGTDWGTLDLVSGAIIYDYGARTSKVYPDKVLGRAAMQAALPGRFPLGARGAGRSARCGWYTKEASGQGGAFREVGGVKLAVFTVVNALGAIVDRQGAVVRGNLNDAGDRPSVGEELEHRLTVGTQTPPTHGNTTLTLVVTNQRLEPYGLQQLARQVHASMARAIQPFHTLNDGDVLFAVSTDEVDEPALREPALLGTLASELAWDAVLSSAP